MSDSRSQRRQSQRGGTPSGPQRRDPMTTVYIVLGVIVVLIVAGLGIMRWNQNRAFEAAVATPSPMPTTSGGPTPVPLVDGTSIGKKMFASGKQGADTPSGGHGQPVDGVQCAGMEYATLHVHPHLAIFYNGTQVRIPRLIGGTPTASGGCLYWIHTHDETGIIHIESPVLAPEGASGFTLGMLFDIWGEPLDRNNVAGLKGPVTAFVNGEKYDGELRMIELKAHNQITLEVGTPVVPPPVYAFPPNE